MKRMDREAAEAILRAAGWLSRRPAAFQASLLKRSVLVNFNRGEHAYSVGDPTGGIFGILHGSFALEVATLHAPPRMAHIVRQAMWFGSGPVLTGHPRVVTFRALEPSSALKVPITALNELSAADPLAFQSIGAMSEEHTRLGIHGVSDLLIRQSDRRIAAVLLRISGVTVLDPTPPPHEARITQKELGDVANASRDVVGRTLSRFEAKGWIALGYHRITVTNSDALVAFAYNESK